MDEARRRLADLVEELLGAQRSIDALHGDLAAHPDHEGKREAQLQELVAARDEATARLGALLSRWVRGGGRVELTGADEPRAALALVPPATDPATEEESGDGDGRSASLVDVRALEGALVPAWARRPPEPSIDYLPMLEHELEELGEPALIDSDAASQAELMRLGRAVDRFEAWTHLPRTVHRLLLCLVAARARHVQSEAGFTPAEDSRVLFVFNRLRYHQSHNDPGYVFGLKRDHQPRISWLEEALQTWSLLRTDLDAPKRPTPTDARSALQALRSVLDAKETEERWVEEAVDGVLEAGIAPTDERLLRLLSARLEAVPQTTKFRSLRRAVRALNDAEEGPDAEAQAEPPLPADWPLFGLTRKKRGVLVGGTVREDARVRLEKSFEFASLEWEGASRVRVVQGLVERIHRGSVDLMVLLIRFMSHPVHAMLNDACKSSGTPHVLLERGYGVQHLRQAIEAHLGPKPGDGRGDR